MRDRLPSLAFLGILIYCLWSSSDLLHAWGGGRLDKSSWIILLIWILPVILYWTVPPLFSKNAKPNNTVLMIIGLVCALIGNIGSLNFMSYIGLSFAFASLLPWSPWLIPWMISSIAWMPGFNWIAMRFGLDWLILLKIPLSLLGSLWVIIFCGLYKKGVVENE